MRKVTQQAPAQFSRNLVGRLGVSSGRSTTSTVSLIPHWRMTPQLTRLTVRRRWAALSSTVLSTFLVLAPGQAIAQETPRDAQAVPTAAVNDNSIGDIVVTARRREENAQRVPIAITVLSPETLKSNNVSTLQDIQNLVPSLSANTANVGQRDAVNVAIRGQGYGSIAGQPAVAMYLNEVPIPTDYDGSLAGGPGLLFDLENVQVLKGPQGTLFGKNTMGGAVLLQSARPTNELGARIQVGYGNYNNREIDAVANVPLVSDKLLFRVAFNAQKRDGFSYARTPRSPNGIDLDNRDFYSVRGTLTAKPFDGFKNDLIVTYQSYKSHGSADFLVDITPGGFADTLYPATMTSPGIRALVGQQQALGARQHLPIDTDLRGTNGLLFAIENISTLDLSQDISLRNIFGYHRAIFDYKADVDGTAFPLFNVVADRYPPRQVSDELQLAGKALGGRLDFVFGGFYSNTRPDNGVFPRLGVRVVLPAGTPDSTINVDINRRLELESKAIFGQGTLNLGSGFRLTGGLRYTWDDRNDSSRDANNVVTNSPSSSRALTYTAGLDFQASPDTLLYVTTRRGYRQGGSTTASNGVIFPFGPEFVTDYEGGVKSTFDAGGVKIRTNADVYYQNYSSIQVNQLINYAGQPGGLNVTTNAGSARLWGAEFEGLIVFTPRFQIGANFAYLNFKYKTFAPGVDGAALEAGKTANRIPFEYGINAQYDLPLPEKIGRVSLRANYHWQDKFGDFLGTSTIPAYGLVNASLNWDRVGGGPVDAQLFVSNLTNKTYYSGGIGFLGFTERTYGDPRLYGLRLTVRLGGMVNR